MKLEKAWLILILVDAIDVQMAFYVNLGGH